ncbi:MAG: DUF3990 domain-containing protein [Bacteroidales bacterium]|jgi:hypothetical protein|nr:DUF3990 domain-containing protein [Bacteroidales bacterium]
MKLYHGTNIEFGIIDLAKCPPDRDFGQGFYTTSIEYHAERRAEEAVRKFGGVAKVMEFDFDFDAVMQANPTLKIKRFENVNEQWAYFVMHNRLRKENDPQHEYDIVEGPVANDKMFRQFQRFMSNRIELQEFVRNIKFRENTHQIAFCTKRAIDVLLDCNEPPRYKIESLVSELSVALMKDQNISAIEAMNIVYNSDIFAQLSDYSNLLYLKSWQDIYCILQKELSAK